MERRTRQRNKSPAKNGETVGKGAAGLCCCSAMGASARAGDTAPRVGVVVLSLTVELHGAL